MKIKAATILFILPLLLALAFAGKVADVKTLQIGVKILTLTAWWVIPLVWLPVASWLVSMSFRMGLPLPQVALAVPFATMILGVPAALLEGCCCCPCFMDDVLKPNFRYECCWMWNNPFGMHFLQVHKAPALPTATRSSSNSQDSSLDSTRSYGDATPCK